MKQMIEVLVDDLDGKSPAKTVTFALYGTTYEIDLSDKNIERLKRALEPFVNASLARKSTASKTRPAAKKATAKPRTKAAKKAASRKRNAGPTDHQIRSWAIENGVEVGKAGRVSKAARDAFLAAHDAKTSKPTVADVKNAAEKGALSDAA